jgi:predicted Zn-dependent protease with MMP-like domain
MAQEEATKFGLTYHGLLNNINIELTEGLYQTSVEDLGIEGIINIIDKFDIVRIFEQKNSTDNKAYLQRLTLNNQLNIEDAVYPEIDDKILFIGCSHTAGIGHAAQETVYPYLLSTQLKIEPMVLGQPGRGNYLFEELLSSYSLKGARVIIQFSDIFRVRYHNSQGKLIENQGKYLTKEELEIFTEEKLTQDFLSIVNRIVIRLRDANAQFLFFQISRDHPTNLLINYELSKYKEFCWIPDVNQDFAIDNLHLGILSHQLIANKLLTRWNKLYAQK